MILSPIMRNRTTYAILNALAQSWPYYRNNRPKQREDIRRKVQTIREARLMTIGHGGPVIYGQDAKHGHRWTLTGFNAEPYAALLARRGVPVIDLTTAGFSDLCRFTISGPMVAITDRENAEALASVGKFGPFDHIPTTDWIKRALAIGATQVQP